MCDSLMTLARGTLNTMEMGPPCHCHLPAEGWKGSGADWVERCEHRSACAVRSPPCAPFAHSLKESAPFLLFLHNGEQSKVPALTELMF